MIIQRFAFWNPGTWQIPKLYWDAFSDEQRIHAICKQLGKVIAYADYLGINVDDIAERLKAIEEGQLDQVIIDVVEQWFEDNQPAIMTALQNLEEALPISEFDSVNTVKAAIDTKADKNNFVAYSWYYDLDKTGTEDITADLQDIVDALPAGTVFVFETGTYKFGGLNVDKEFYFDFSNSDLIITDERGIIFEADKVKDFNITGNIDANYCVLSTSDTLSDESIVFIKNDTQTATEDRGYYRVGLVGEIYHDHDGNACIEPAPPVILNYTGSLCSEYAKTSFGVKNVKSIVFTNATYYKYAFAVRYGYGCIFDNIQCHGEIRSIISLEYCVNTTISNVNANLKVVPNADGIVYPINISNCSNTIIQDCRITSDWHALSTQGYYFTLNTIIQNCELASGTAEAYLDHSGGINGKIINSSLTGGALVGCGAVIENCNIYSSSQMEAHIYIKPSQLSLNGIDLSNVTFWQQDVDELAKAPIRFYYSRGDGGSSVNAVSVKWLNLSNCSLVNPEGTSPILITSTDNTLPSLTVNQICAINSNIGVVSQPNTTIVYSEVQISNATLNQNAYNKTLFYMPTALTNQIGRLKIENTHLVTRGHPFVEALAATIMISNMTINANTPDNVAVDSGHIMYGANISKTGAATVLQAGANTHFVNTYLS